jgi:four helix bundle protein
MALIKSFEELQCWKVGRELRIEISKVIKDFPAHERFELVSQMRRASRSVTNNIAEGFGRYHYQEFMRFCRISRGSLTELSDHLIVALDEGYIDKIQHDELRTAIERCIALINGFITYLERRKQKAHKGRVEEPMEPYGADKLSEPETDQRIN